MHRSDRPGIGAAPVWLRTRRYVLAMAGVGAPASMLLAGAAHALSVREATPAEAEDYANRCRVDAMHAASLDEVIVRLRTARVAFDEARLRATLSCPLCGCPAITAEQGAGPEAGKG